MKRSGTADLPLHTGYIPKWLADRMSSMAAAITEAVITEYGQEEFLRRLSDPFWFQSFGTVMGMDWHSSGITTSVMGALKSAINPRSRELGIYVCGGKGKNSLKAPAELLNIGSRTGLNATELIRCSRLTAKVDNTAIQDGFQLYTHSFILSASGSWSVVQQGMQRAGTLARRYHWHSASVRSFVEEPHTAVCGLNQGPILNLTAREAALTRSNIFSLMREDPRELIRETQRLIMPAHHDVRAKDVDLKRLGATLWLAHEKRPADFEELLLLEGVGPRTVQALTLVSEIIHGSPSRFSDPARFSFAHGGKDGHPFPVPLKVYDESINTLQTALHKARIDNSDKLQAIKRLSEISRRAEQNFVPNNNFHALLEKERRESHQYGGMTVGGEARPPANGQLSLF